VSAGGAENRSRKYDESTRGGVLRERRDRAAVSGEQATFLLHAPIGKQLVRRGDAGDRRRLSCARDLRL